MCFPLFFLIYCAAISGSDKLTFPETNRKVLMVKMNFSMLFNKTAESWKSLIKESKNHTIQKWRSSKLAYLVYNARRLDPSWLFFFNSAVKLGLSYKHCLYYQGGYKAQCVLRACKLLHDALLYDDSSTDPSCLADSVGDCSRDDHSKPAQALFQVESVLNQSRLLTRCATGSQLLDASCYSQQQEQALNSPS